MLKSCRQFVSEGVQLNMKGSAMHEYLFDVKMFTAIRVKASSISAARAMIRDSINCADANLGSWPDGSPILCEISMDDEHPDLIEVDNEAV